MSKFQKKLIQRLHPELNIKEPLPIITQDQIAICIFAHSHTTIARKYMFEGAIRSAAHQGIKCYLIYDSETAEEQIAFARQFPTIEPIKKPEMRGQIEKFIWAIKNCKEKYLAILHDDDYYANGYIETVLRGIHSMMLNNNVMPDFILTSLFYIVNGIPETLKHTPSENEEFLTVAPPSRWVLNLESIRRRFTQDIESHLQFDWGWDDIFGNWLLTWGTVLSVESAHIFYNYSSDQITSSTSEELKRLGHEKSDAFLASLIKDPNPLRLFIYQK
jgi:hypothetical protein